MPTGAGNRRWRRTRSRGSPSRVSAPRRSAAIAFGPPGRDPVERGLVGLDHDVGVARAGRDGDRAVPDVDQPLVRPSVVGDLEAQDRAGVGRAAARRPRLRQVVEELRRCVSHLPVLRHPSRGGSWGPRTGRRPNPVSPRIDAAVHAAHHPMSTIPPARLSADPRQASRASPLTTSRSPSHDTAPRSATTASTGAPRARWPIPITVPTPAARAAAIPDRRVLDHDRARRLGAEPDERHAVAVGMRACRGRRRRPSGARAGRGSRPRPGAGHGERAVGGGEHGPPIRPAAATMSSRAPGNAHGVGGRGRARSGRCPRAPAASPAASTNARDGRPRRLAVADRERPPPGPGRARSAQVDHAATTLASESTRTPSQSNTIASGTITRSDRDTRARAQLTGRLRYRVTSSRAAGCIRTGGRPRPDLVQVVEHHLADLEERGRDAAGAMGGQHEPLEAARPMVRRQRAPRARRRSRRATGPPRPGRAARRRRPPRPGSRGRAARPRGAGRARRPRAGAGCRR